MVKTKSNVKSTKRTFIQMFTSLSKFIDRTELGTGVVLGGRRQYTSKRIGFWMRPIEVDLLSDLLQHPEVKRVATHISNESL